MGMALAEEQWSDEDGTAHVVTIEARDSAYVVRHELNMRGGSSASWELGYESLPLAREAFTVEVQR